MIEDSAHHDDDPRTGGSEANRFPASADTRVPLDVAQLRIPRQMTSDEIIAVELDPDDGHLRVPVGGEVLR